MPEVYAVRIQQQQQAKPQSAVEKSPKPSHSLPATHKRAPSGLRATCSKLMAMGHGACCVHHQHTTHADDDATERYRASHWQAFSQVTEQTCTAAAHMCAWPAGPITALPGYAGKAVHQQTARRQAAACMCLNVASGWCWQSDCAAGSPRHVIPSTGRCCHTPQQSIHTGAADTPHTCTRTHQQANHCIASACNAPRSAQTSRL